MVFLLRLPFAIKGASFSRFLPSLWTSIEQTEEVSGVDKGGFQGVTRELLLTLLRLTLHKDATSYYVPETIKSGM